MESQISEIRSNLDDAVEGVKKLAPLRRYNATHSVFGTRWHSNSNKDFNKGKNQQKTPYSITSRYYGSQEDYKKDSEAKYDNSRRYRDPISINDRSLTFDIS